MNKTVFSDDLADAARARTQQHGHDLEGYRVAIARLHDEALVEHPIYLGIVDGVKYNDKSDRYVVTFNSGKSSAKITEDAAQYLMTEDSGKRGARAAVHAHMSDGVIDAVALFFLAK